MSATVDALRHRFQAALRDRMPDHLDRLRWDRERIASYQQRQLRLLLREAIERSPFHARRLRGVDPDRFGLDELSSLPIMTKADMMAAFDNVVADRRLTLDRVQAHLAATNESARLLDDNYFAIATGGTSGLRGVFVYDWDGMVELAARLAASGGPPRQGRSVIAAIGSPSAIHVLRLGFSLIEGPAFQIVNAPVTWPLAEIVRCLNEAQPDVLFGYPSVLHRLAIEQQAGRLTVRPSRIRTGAEQLRPEVERCIAAAFGAPIFDTFGASEGLLGTRPPGEEAFTFATDLVIVELVDEHNQPVTLGTSSAKVLLTNLFNTVQPLIRYALEDRFVRRSDAVNHGHLVATVEGRASKAFVYGDTYVHPATVLRAVTKAPAIVDYQIRQTPGGIDADVLVNGHLDRTGLADELAQALARAGVPDPRVSVRIVDRFDADPRTGKLRRLVPLPGHGRGTAAAGAN
jgi:phenylacetate-coenzyme A ligase PaaK-like adenylate-forming protein